jgi:putative sterol carrier protein
MATDATSSDEKSPDAGRFESSDVFDHMRAALKSLSPDEREQLVKTAKGIYQIDLTNKEGKTASWILDLAAPESLDVRSGTHANPTVRISWDDEGLVGMSAGKVSSQKAFMQGKLKAHGNIMLATKLEPVMKQLAQHKSKL